MERKRYFKYCVNNIYSSSTNPLIIDKIYEAIRIFDDTIWITDDSGTTDVYYLTDLDGNVIFEEALSLYRNDTINEILK